eukprot:7383361-Prymnesium_polylepis.1
MVATMLLGWDFGRPRFWAGPFLTGMLGFGDGSWRQQWVSNPRPANCSNPLIPRGLAAAGTAPPTSAEKLLLKFGITSASEDLYFNDHLHDGSKQRAPKGVHVGDLAPMPVELLIQGFRGRTDMRVMSSVGRCGRRDDPFPERFHTKEEVKVRKKLVKVINAVKILKASGALSAAGAAAKVGGSGSGSRLNARRRAIKIVPFIGNKEK